MLELKTEFDDSEYKKAKDDFPKMIQQAGLSTGDAIVDIVNQGIRERVLPDGSGWIDWYLRSMQWVRKKADLTWDLQIEEDIKLRQIPEGRSLLWIRGGFGEVGEFFRKHSPWSLSNFPRLRGGYSGSALVRPVSADEISFHENRIRKISNAIGSLLSRNDLSALAETLSFHGGFEVDVDFLVKRIEHGLGGFARQPHLVYIKQMVFKKMKPARRFDE